MGVFTCACMSYPFSSIIINFKPDFSLNLEFADSARLAAQQCPEIFLSLLNATQSQLPNPGIAIPPHLVSHVVSETLNSYPLIQIPKIHKETLVDPEHLFPGPKPHSHPVFCVIGFNDLCASVKNLEHFFSYNMYNIQKLQSLCSGYNAHVPTSKSVNLSASLSIVTCLH